MALLSARQREGLLRATKEAASALVEDLEYLRVFTQQEDTLAAEIRRVSSVLRRLLVERDIAKVAAPRMGKILLSAPDNGPIYKSAKTAPPLLFLSGRGKVFGWAGSLLAADQPGGVPIENPMPRDFDPDRTVQMRVDNFVAQHVLCYRGDWFSRGEIIKYVANVAAGVHSGEPETVTQSTLAAIRSSNMLSIRNGGVHVELFKHGVYADPVGFRYTKDTIDIVLVEIVSAAHFIANSPKVAELERLIRAELS